MTVTIKPVPELPQATTINDTDDFVLNQSGTVRRVVYTKLRDKILALFANKTVLDDFSDIGGFAAYKGVILNTEQSNHTHSNKSTLDLLSTYLSSPITLYFDGRPVGVGDIFPNKATLLKFSEEADPEKLLWSSRVVLPQTTTVDFILQKLGSITAPQGLVSDYTGLHISEVSYKVVSGSPTLKIGTSAGASDVLDRTAEPLTGNDHIMISHDAAGALYTEVLGAGSMYLTFHILPSLY